VLTPSAKACAFTLKVSVFAPALVEAPSRVKERSSKAESSIEDVSGRME